MDNELFVDCQDFLRSIDLIGHDHGESLDSFIAFRSLLAAVTTTYTENPASPTITKDLDLALSRLAEHAYCALQHEPEYFATLTQVLVTTSRISVSLRKLFGKTSRPPQHVPVEPDCTLDIARRITTLKHPVPSQVIENNLRIIANCCIDSNANQAVIIHRDGIRSLLDLAQHGANLDLLIPTLYNVCVDYDEPSAIRRQDIRHDSDADDTAAVLSEASDTAELENTGQPTLATDLLGAAFRSSGEFTTFELLLTLSSGLEGDYWDYLSMLIEMATRSVLGGFEQIRNSGEYNHIPWSWSFSVRNRHYRTIDLVLKIAAQHWECRLEMSRTIFNLMSQDIAKKALVELEDDSIWKLMTLPCGEPDDLDTDYDYELRSELVNQRGKFLKMLYEVTYTPSFSRNEKMAVTLVKKCVGVITSSVTMTDGAQNWSVEQDANSSLTHIRTSACVILAALCTHGQVRNTLLEEPDFTKALVLLLDAEKKPDILYPAVIIVARLATSIEKDIAFAHTGALQSVQRFLTAKGLGLVLPLESVAVYTTAVYKQKKVINVLLAQNPALENRSVVQDIFTLWNITGQAGTKLQIGKFFRDFFSSTLPLFPLDKTSENNTVEEKEDIRLIDDLKTFLDKDAYKIAQVFVWVCLEAEPVSQRDHGWFGLSLLSLWPVARSTIRKLLAERHNFKEAVIKASQLTDGSIRHNLSAILTIFKEKSDEVSVEEQEGLEYLQEAMTNLGLE